METPSSKQKQKGNKTNPNLKNKEKKEKESEIKSRGGGRRRRNQIESVECGHYMELPLLRNTRKTRVRWGGGETGETRAASENAARQLTVGWIGTYQSTWKWNYSVITSVHGRWRLKTSAGIGNKETPNGFPTQLFRRWHTRAMLGRIPLVRKQAFTPALINQSGKWERNKRQRGRSGNYFLRLPSSERKEEGGRWGEALNFSPIELICTGLVSILNPIRWSVESNSQQSGQWPATKTNSIDETIKQKSYQIKERSNEIGPNWFVTRSEINNRKSK